LNADLAFFVFHSFARRPLIHVFGLFYSASLSFFVAQASDFFLSPKSQKPFYRKRFENLTIRGFKSIFIVLLNKKKKAGFCAGKH
jgi:hypothetical protein